MSIDHAGPFQIVAEEAHEESAELLFLPEESAFKTIDSPSVVGELAFFDGAPRSATLDALTDVQVVRIDLDCFRRLSEAEPALAETMLMDLARILALRLRMASEVIERLRG